MKYLVEIFDSISRAEQKMNERWNQTPKYRVIGVTDTNAYFTVVFERIDE